MIRSLLKISILVIVILVSFSVQAKNRGRNQFILSADGTWIYGFSDRTDVFFNPTGVTDLKYSAFGARLGVEGITENGFSAKLMGGYHRLFYSSTGVAQAKKNFGFGALLFGFHPLKNINRWDPYVFAGPQIWFSKSGTQGYANAGVGVKYFINDRWSVRLEPSVLTDFRGASVQVATGANFHF